MLVHTFACAYTYMHNLAGNHCLNCNILFRYGGGQVQSAEGGGEGEESGKEGASVDPNYALSGKLTADTNTFRVSCNH